MDSIGVEYRASFNVGGNDWLLISPALRQHSGLVPIIAVNLTVVGLSPVVTTAITYTGSSLELLNSCNSTDP